MMAAGQGPFARHMVGGGLAGQTLPSSVTASLQRHSNRCAPAMTRSPRLRKFALTAHIGSSVGWLGAVAGFLALAIIDLTGQDAQIVRAAYLGMDWIGWFVLVPLSFASLLTGLVQALGTEWGLFRHYWILAKLLINVLGNVGLLMFMLIFGSVVAAVPASALDDVGELRSPSPLLHAGVALLVLLLATVLSVYKPRGITPYAWRKQHERCKALQRKKQHRHRAQEATGARIEHADRSRTTYGHEHMLGVPVDHHDVGPAGLRPAQQASRPRIQMGDAGVRGDKERVEGLIDGHLVGQVANPLAGEQRLAPHIQDVERVPWNPDPGVAVDEVHTRQSLGDRDRDGPRPARGGEQCDRAVLPAHVGHARAGVHSQRDRGIPGPMTTDTMTEPWSRVCTTVAAKAAAPPFTTTAMRRLSMRLLRSGSDSGSQPRDPHATQPAGASLDADHADADHAVVAGYLAGGDGALAGIAHSSHVNNTLLTR